MPAWLVPVFWFDLFGAGVGERVVHPELFAVVTGGCAPVTDQSDSLKSRVIAGECDVLGSEDELDKSWTKTWTAPPNPLVSGLYGDHRHSPKSVVASDLALGQELDTIAKVGAR